MFMKKVPIVPGKTPVRILVVSPFTSDASAYYKGEIALTKPYYTIEPAKIRALYQFWLTVDNDVMKHIIFDEDSFSNLPKDTTSPEVLHVENDGLGLLVEASSETPDFSRDSSKKSTVIGRECLLRSVDEEIDATLVSCTVTIGDQDITGINDNEHEQLVDLRSGIDHQTTEYPSTKTFVVRPGPEFVSDSMPKYLETLYPDLFPFGRGGFDEIRRIRISKKALVAYYAKISTRQF